jgi:aldehyde:ferredoxin oxidoreductase
MYGGYAGKLLYIDLTKHKISKVPLSKDLCIQYLGGRGRDAKILFDEINENVHPLSPDNVLCISTGPVTGLLGPTTGRVNVAAISPLTNIYGNSNAGTNFGAELKYAGYDGLVIKGKASELTYIYIEDDIVELKPAEHLQGKGVIETTSTLHEDYGYDVKIAAVGPAAEGGVLFASVIFDFWDAAGRCGLGTVMASKNLKSIVVTGSGELTIAHPDRYYELIKEGWNAILTETGFKTGEHSALGTLVCVNWGNAQGWLPTKNFQESVFKDADSISGEEFRDKYSTKPAPLPGGRACLSCPNRCKRFGRVESGKYAGTKGGIEFEGVAAFGSKCGVNELDAVYHAYMLANDYGMDCITCGNTIAFLMELHERGILDHHDLENIDLHFGNADGMIEMIHRIGTMTGKIGKLCAQGSYRVSKSIGKGSERYLTTIKGLESIACDPRTAKGFGFTYAIASRGSDHLRAHPVFEMLRMPVQIGEEMFGTGNATRIREYGGKVEMVIWHENISAITDSIGSCRFMHASYYAVYPIPELLCKYGRISKAYSIKYHEWISAATGMKIDYSQMLEIGDRIINLERAINVRLGIRRVHDTLPQRFMNEPLPTGPTKGEIFSVENLNKMIDRYYEIRGWDKKSGLPKKNKLIRLGMHDVLSVLESKSCVV